MIIIVFILPQRCTSKIRTKTPPHSVIAAIWQIVQVNAALDERFVKLTAKNGKPYFNLKARNSQVIGKSEMYESEKARQNGIESVKKNAPSASTIEE